MNTEVQYNQRPPGGNPYLGGNAPGDHRSYETVASGSGISGERPGYMTDPTSSDNSSMDRRQSPPKRQAEPVPDYGIGFSQTAQYQPSAFTIGGGSQQGYQADVAGPAVPRKDGSIMRKPIQNSEGGSAKQKKRRSWFGLGKGN